MCKVLKKITKGERRNLGFIWNYFFALTSNNLQKPGGIYEQRNLSLLRGVHGAMCLQPSTQTKFKKAGNIMELRLALMSEKCEEKSSYALQKFQKSFEKSLLESLTSLAS